MRQPRFIYSPITGDKLMKGMTPKEYRTKRPKQPWCFNPWTGKKRDSRDVQSDPQGLLIWLKAWGPLRVGERIPITIKSPSSARDTQVAGTHYKEMGVQPWDVVDTWPLEQRIGFYRGGALKYIMRMGAKDENAQEIAKGKHYMEKLLEVLNERPAA